MTAGFHRAVADLHLTRAHVVHPDQDGGPFGLADGVTATGLLDVLRMVREESAT